MFWAPFFLLLLLYYSFLLCITSWLDTFSSPSCISHLAKSPSLNHIHLLSVIPPQFSLTLLCWSSPVRFFIISSEVIGVFKKTWKNSYYFIGEWMAKRVVSISISLPLPKLNYQKLLRNTKKKLASHAKNAFWVCGSFAEKTATE